MAGLQSVRGVDFPGGTVACKNGKSRLPDSHKESTTLSCQVKQGSNLGIFLGRSSLISANVKDRHKY